MHLRPNFLETFWYTLLLGVLTPGSEFMDIVLLSIEGNMLSTMHNDSQVAESSIKKYHLISGIFSGKDTESELDFVNVMENQRKLTNVPGDIMVLIIVRSLRDDAAAWFDRQSFLGDTN